MAVEGVDPALPRIHLPVGTNLADLGPEADLRDATAIVDIVGVAHRHKTAIRAGFIRRMVDDVWQTKRLFALPGGYAYGHGIYRRALPWSAAAVDRARETQRISRGLILEHVIPVGLTLAMVEAASSPEQVVEVLRRDLILAVITREESRRLDHLGFNRVHPDPTQPWSRYEAARIAMLPGYPKIGHPTDPVEGKDQPACGDVTQF